MGKRPIIEKKHIKLVVDIFMTILLVFLMAYQVTGDLYHEFIGAGMLVLFLIHNGLNIKWYRGLTKGKWSAFRVVYSLINILVLAAILLTGYSGIVLSRHVFAFLPIRGGMATARILHFACSYWAFVLMSIHLGLHWNMVLRKWKIDNQIFRILRRIAALVIAIYGVICFGRADILGNMLLQNEFVFGDYDTADGIVLLNNLCMMATWTLVGHYFVTGMSWIGKRSEKREK